MCSEESKDGRERADIVRGGFGFLRGEVDIAVVVGDKDVLVSATRFHGQLTSGVGSRRTVAGNSTDERGGSLKRWGQGNPRGKGWINEERRVQGRVRRVGFWRSAGSFELRLGDQGRLKVIGVGCGGVVW